MSQLIDDVRRSRNLPPPAVAKAIREAADVSQQQVADDLHVHRVTVARWESGERTPRGAVRALYADLLADLQAATAA